MSGTSNKKYIADHRLKRSEEFPNIIDTFDVESLNELLINNPELINKTDEKTGWTMLFRAVMNGNYQIADFLLEKNSNPDIQNVYGDTPLHQAVENGNHKIINLLLEKGSNPNIQQQVFYIYNLGWRISNAYSRS